MSPEHSVMFTTYFLKSVSYFDFVFYCVAFCIFATEEAVSGINLFGISNLEEIKEQLRNNRNLRWGKSQKQN